MKKLYLLTLFIPALIFSQNPALFGQDWRLTDLIIDGISAAPPSNSEVESIILSFENGEVSSLQTQVCNTASGMPVYGGDNTFTLNSFSVTLMKCSFQENSSYEFLYFTSFFSFDPADTFTYEIIELGDVNILVITSNESDVAIYQSQPLSTTTFDMHAIRVYPTPVSGFLNIGLSGFSEQNISVKIYNCIGRRCFEKSVNNHEGIDVSFCPLAFISLKRRTAIKN